MMRKIGTLLFGLMSTSALAQPVITPPTFIPPPTGGGGGTLFVPPTFAGVQDPILYIAPNGNDACNGTSPAIGTSGNCAWKTYNHAVNCGDVVVTTAIGAYNGDMSAPGVVSNCPSTSGGIDGTGGITAAVLLCSPNGGDITSCSVNCATAPCNGGSAFRMRGSNWAVINWNINGNGQQTIASTTEGPSGFVMDACASGTTQRHHDYIINSIITHAGAGSGGDDCALNHNVPGNGMDYYAAVGTINQDAARRAICNSAIDFIAASNIDTNPGTHGYVYGNFVYSTQAPLCSSPPWAATTAYTAGLYRTASGSLYVETVASCTSGSTAPTGTGTGISDGGSCLWNRVQGQGGNSDVEGIMFDTIDAHGFQGLGSIVNNLVWNDLRYGVQIFYQGYHNASVQVHIYNNTLYGENSGGTHDATGAFGPGSINLAGSNPGGAGNPTNWALIIQNNIVRNNSATTFDNQQIYAATYGGVTWGSLTSGGTGNQNWYKGLATTCVATCNSTRDVVVFNSNPLGTDTYSDPLFTNTADLLANWIGAPNCAGKQTTTQCMGYDPITATLTTNTPISDLKPTATGSASKGYQLPSSTCGPVADYPSWLKGLVRLTAVWSGGVVVQLVQKRDVVTVPCGL